MRSALALLVASLVSASAVAAGSSLGMAEADGKATVTTIQSARATDLVILSAGYDHGFRPGAVCTVSHDGKPFGSVVIAEANRSRAVALILNLDPQSQISPGDLVSPRANPRI